MESTQESVKTVTYGKAFRTHFLDMSSKIKKINKFHNSYKKSKYCWDWKNGSDGNGYGALRLDGEQWRAHRLMWFLTYGRIKRGMYVLHHCDNKKCVNPKHLFLGTAQDNIDDCINKGRFRVASGKNHGTKTHPERIARGIRHGSKTHPEKWRRGEELPWSKLNKRLVKKIRKEYRPGVYGTERLAKKYGVSQTTIYCLVTGKTWKHVKST